MSREMRELVLKSFENQERYSLLDLQIIGLFKCPTLEETLLDLTKKIMWFRFLTEIADSLPYYLWLQFYENIYGDENIGGEE